MPFNGAGGAVGVGRPQYPPQAGETILAEYFSAIIDDILAMLSQVYVRDGQAPMIGSLDAGNQIIKNVLDPVSPQDAATKFYVEALRASILALLATATASRSMGGFTLTDVATPVNANDAANKAYVTAQAFLTALPAQAGNAGLEITTDGALASWGYTAPGAAGALAYLMSN